jgi:drug/metabolite transporter (DMT)-like permease
LRSILSQSGALGVVCTALAMLLMFYPVTHAGASRAFLITYINPVVATVLGEWMLREHLGFGAMTGFALILVGSGLASRTAARIVRASARAA